MTMLELLSRICQVADPSSLPSESDSGALARISSQTPTNIQSMRPEGLDILPVYSRCLSAPGDLNYEATKSSTSS